MNVNLTSENSSITKSVNYGCPGITTVKAEKVNMCTIADGEYLFNPYEYVRPTECETCGRQIEKELLEINITHCGRCLGI